MLGFKMIVKTKKVVYMVLMLFISALYAEWDTITFEEHVERSSLIVVAEYERELERKEVEIGVEQLVSFNVVELIKGDANGTLEVRGQAFEMCVAQMLFDNTPNKKYLLFLEREDNATVYNLVHGERSGLMIENRSVKWIEDRDKIDLGRGVLTPLTEVKREIEEMINKVEK